jgi:hypothetical protein
MSKDKKASAKDAQVLMQLYDLRREPVMRLARKFMVSEFWPQSYEEFKGLMLDFGSEGNAFARQCLTYWDMAAAMVLHGAVDEDFSTPPTESHISCLPSSGNICRSCEENTSALIF